MTDRELLEENNKMLKEILSFVRKVDSAEYRDHQDFMEFLRNVAADIWVEYTEPEQRSKLFNLINKEKEVVYPRTGVPVFMLKDVGIGFRTIEGATEVANLLVKYNAFKIESRFLTGSYEQFWIIKESVCPAIKGEAGYSKEEFDKVNKENQDPELESINSFNNTLKNANEIKDRVLKYVYNIKQERSYNNDLVGIFERYKDIADGDMEVAMNFIKEAYPFNEETESFIRKKFDMPMPDESKEQ